VGPPRIRKPSFAGLLAWWLIIGTVLSAIAWALVGIVYSRVIYYFVVVPIVAVRLFPAAWAANRWLTPVITSRLGRP